VATGNSLFIRFVLFFFSFLILFGQSQKIKIKINIVVYKFSLQNRIEMPFFRTRKKGRKERTILLVTGREYVYNLIVTQ